MEIKSFRNSWWRDGLAFAAIVAAFRPELLDFDRLRSSAGPPRHRRATAPSLSPPLSLLYALACCMLF